MSFFDTHEPGCTPRRPCAKCELAAFLAAELPEGSFPEAERLVGMIDFVPKPVLTPGCPYAAPYDMSIKHLELTVGAHNCLKGAGHEWVGDVVQLTRKEVLKIINVGKHRANEIQEALAAHGFQLGTRVERIR